MDKVTLMFFEDVLMNDVQSTMSASQAPQGVDDENLKRALNIQLEAIKSDVINIQHLIET